MTQETQAQAEFLLDAMAKLKLDTEAFAARINTPPLTLKKWLQPPEMKSNYREMPGAMWAHVREILAHEALKRKYEKLQKKVEQTS